MTKIFLKHSRNASVSQIPLHPLFCHLYSWLRHWVTRTIERWNNDQTLSDGVILWLHYIFFSNNVNYKDRKEITILCCSFTANIANLYQRAQTALSWLICIMRARMLISVLKLHRNVLARMSIKNRNFRKWSWAAEPIRHSGHGRSDFLKCIK